MQSGNIHQFHPADIVVTPQGATEETTDALLAGCGGPKNNLSGKVDIGTDTLLVYVWDAEGAGTDYADTIAVTDGLFSMTVPDTAAFYITLAEKPAPGGRMTSYSDRFLFLPGDAMYVEGPLDELKISGTELYDALEGTAEYKRLDAALDSLYGEWRAVYNEDKEKADSIRALMDEADKAIDTFMYEYVKANPDNLLSGFFTTRLPEKESVEAWELLSDNVRNGKMKGVLDVSIERSRQMLVIEENWNKMKPGYKVPDFSLKNLDGEYMTLDSFKGKYALIDFWGTWCGWCIKGIPDMKAAYGKYKDRLEIVGIDCRDSEEKWREGVEKYELPWTNLYNGDSDEITVAYGVQGYPCKILIDPESKVVEAFLGEDPALYKKLDELFR